MIVKETGGGKEFEQPEPGSYAAICYKMLDLGTQVGEYKGEPTSARKLVIFWELAEKMTDGRPFSVCQYYTMSLNEKANLRKMMESWRTRQFTEDELKGFDLRKLLGKSCMISLTRTDKGKIKVAGVSALPKGMPIPAQVNPSLAFSLDSFDPQVFEGLTDYWKGQIMDSPEYRLINSGEVDAVAAQAATDDIPF